MERGGVQIVFSRPPSMNFEWVAEVRRGPGLVVVA